MINSTQQQPLKDKWNQRYKNSSTIGSPCWVLENHKHLLPKSGTGLDLACGLGANALLMSQCGLSSHAWDISNEALLKLSAFANDHQLAIHTSERDVENVPPEPESFNVIVVSQFLYRPIFPAIINALKPGGLLFYQTFHQNKCSSHGPSSPDFLLKTGELLSVFSSLQLVFYREDSNIGNLDQGLRDCSYFIGQRKE